MLQNKNGLNLRRGQQQHHQGKSSSSSWPPTHLIHVTMLSVATLAVIFGVTVGGKLSFYHLTVTDYAHSKPSMFVVHDDNNDYSHAFLDEEDEKSLFDLHYEEKDSNDYDAAVGEMTTITKDDLKIEDDDLLDILNWKDECNIYMAPTSIKGAVGFGIYTTMALGSGDGLLTSFDSPSIPLVDFGKVYDDDDSFLLKEQRRKQHNLFGDYMWGRGVPDHTRYEGDWVIDHQGTFGSLPNHHCILACLDYIYKFPNYDDRIVASDDPGIGAFSYHNGRYFSVDRHLPAGSEIFLNYGHCERKNDDEKNSNNKDPSWTEQMPVTSDYQEAAERTISMWRDVQGKWKNKTLSFANLLIAKHVGKATNNHVAGLMPSTLQELQRVMEVLTTIPTTNDDDDDDNDNDNNILMMPSTEIVIYQLALTMATTPRTPKWIREHGTCLENIVAWKSKIPHAGRGAILQFPIKRGELVVPVPLIQVMNRTVLDMETVLYHDDEDPNATTKKKKRQLLLNYCFGHAESSLLLCPNTNANLINHCSSRNPSRHCGDGPNAKIQWASSSWDPFSDDWLQMSLSDMAAREDRGISLEVVALRDISPGEEVTIDYGPEWEAAWESHLEQWRSHPPDFDRRLSATEINLQKKKYLSELFVSNDLRVDKEHPQLFCGCVFWWTKSDARSDFDHQNDDWRDIPSDKQLLEKYGDNGRFFKMRYDIHSDRIHWPCSIIRHEQQDEEENKSRSNNKNKRKKATYTVKILPSPRHEKPKWARNNLPRFITNYPLESIHVFHKPHQSDQHLPEAFRHHIGIPDEIMPSHWKNLAR